VSFQSPGIDSSVLDRFDENGGDPDQIRHYVTDGDLVSLAGEVFLPGKVVVSTFEVPEANIANYTQIKHVAGILSDFKAFSANLSPELQAFLGAFDVPENSTLSEISVDDLNRGDFTWQGQEWQGLLGQLQSNNPNFARLLDRQNIEEARYGADGLGNADLDIIKQLSKEVPPEQVNQPTADNDILFGNDCPNIIRGLAGNDYIRAGGGDDVLIGNQGNDALLGNEGDDTLKGGAGNDTLTGGSGADLFIFNGNRLTLGVDKITDFSPAEDLIGLSRTTFPSLGKDLNDSLGIVTDDAAVAASESLIVYNSNNGNLFYNSNGAVDGLGEGGYFANLINQPVLSAENFVLL
jgi:serralysin